MPHVDITRNEDFTYSATVWEDPEREPTVILSTTHIPDLLLAVLRTVHGLNYSSFTLEFPDEAGVDAQHNIFPELIAHYAADVTTKILHDYAHNWMQWSDRARDQTAAIIVQAYHDCRPAAEAAFQAVNTYAKSKAFYQS